MIRCSNDSGNDDNGSEIGGFCFWVPDLYISSKNISSCMTLHPIGSDRPVALQINLTSPRQRSFHVSLSGVGINCSPVGRIVMSTISSNEDLIHCKSLVASHDDGLVTCTYQCKCTDVCSNAVAYFNNKMEVSLCKISGWFVLTSAILSFMHKYAEHTFITLRELKLSLSTLTINEPPKANVINLGQAFPSKGINVTTMI